MNGSLSHADDNLVRRTAAESLKRLKEFVRVGRAWRKASEPESANEEALPAPALSNEFCDLDVRPMTLTLNPHRRQERR